MQAVGFKCVLMLLVTMGAEFGFYSSRHLVSKQTSADTLGASNWSVVSMFQMTRRLTLIAFLLLAFTCSYAQWVPLGPDGGDARSIAYNPQNPDHIVLGTSSGQLYKSEDGGRSWARFARIGTDDYVLDHIVISPTNSKLMFVSAWSVEHQTDAGDLFRSNDGGKSWTTLAFPHNKSIRAMAVAPSDENVIVIGALDG